MATSIEELQIKHRRAKLTLPLYIGILHVKSRKFSPTGARGERAGEGGGGDTGQGGAAGADRPLASREDGAERLKGEDRGLREGDKR